jgi:ketosteroid isomerase-like protein
MEIEMEMKASLLTRNVLALDAISNGVEAGCKQIPHWRYPRLLISSLGVAIFVATAWNAASASVAGDEKTVAALDSQYRTAVKQNGGGQPPQASDVAESPDEAMMAPATALATYMAQVEGAVAPSVFVDDGLIIVENFAPYIFVGKDAAGRWEAGYRQHAGALKDLKFSFGSAHDFTRSGDRVYFVLPTTWGGIYPEGRFEEHGAWSFVLEKSSGRWRIAAYTWGVTDETDWPAVPPTANETNGSGSGDTNEDTRALLAADVAWEKVYAAKDLAKAVAFCDEHGSMLAPNAPIATGKEALARAIASDFAQGNTTWHPNKVGVARSGELGYTSGTTDLTFKDASGKTVTSKGNYLTVWKKVDGSWKVLSDSFDFE